MDQRISDSLAAFTGGTVGNAAVGGGYEVIVISLGILSPFLKEFLVYVFKKCTQPKKVK